MREYRIVRDSWAGYEAQTRVIFFGFLTFGWQQLQSNGYSCNTSATVDRAQALISRHKALGQEVYRERG